MTSTRRRPLGLLPVALLALSPLLAACGEESANEPAPAGAPSAPAATPSADAEPGPGPYRVLGTVIAEEGAAPRICHSVMESWPPQCGGGAELVDFETFATGERAPTTENGVTWGDYEVTGTWDGERLTVTGLLTGEEAGPPPTAEPVEVEPQDRDAAELQAIQAALAEDFGDQVLMSSADEAAGVVRADVVLATPELQATLDDRFGPGAVVLTSWLRPAE